jgi:hypothetical protein
MAVSGEEFGWKSLLELDPKDVCVRSLAVYDDRLFKYTLKIMASEYDIEMKEKKIKPVKGNMRLPEFGVDFNIMILDYLVNSKEIPESGKLVAGAQLKTGEFFFRGTHGLQLEPLIEEFGKDPNRFRYAGIFLGAKIMHLGDISIQLRVLPRVSITYVLWAADQEFPARLSVLFDSTADSQLHLDTLRTAVITANNSLLSVKPPTGAGSNE